MRRHLLLAGAGGLLGALLRPDGAAQPSPPLIERVRALGLPTSRGRITAHHADGAMAVAQCLRELVEQAMAFSAKRLGLAAPLHMAVLNRAQWEALITWQAYGIPCVAGNPPVIFLPATDDGLAAEDALGLRAGISRAARAVLDRAGIGHDEAARRYVDLVGLHELGHAYAHAYGLRVPSRWLDEWPATFFAHAFLRERLPAQALVWDAVLQVYREAVQPAHRSLDDFDRLYDRLQPRLPGFRAWAAEVEAS